MTKTTLGIRLGVILLVAGSLPAAAGDDRAALEAAAEQVSSDLLEKLGGHLRKALSKGDLAAAIAVCREQAPALAGRLSRQHGWRVTRVGTRVRNSLLGMPDAWEQRVMQRFEQRAAAGESYRDMRFAEVVEEPDGRYFRYLRPIGTAPKCLMCHGAPEQIPAPVKAVLARDYPHDRATGYRPGELRGAVSIKRPLAAREE